MAYAARLPLQLEPDFRPIILDFYRDFVQITAHLVTLDIATLQSARQDVSTTGEKHYPMLFAPNFLHCVYYLTRREHPSDEDMGPSPSQGDRMILLRKLEMSQDGNCNRSGPTDQKALPDGFKMPIRDDERRNTERVNVGIKRTRSDNRTQPRDGQAACANR